MAENLACDTPEIEDDFGNYGSVFSIPFLGKEVAIKDYRVSLAEMWEAAGNPPDRDPATWLEGAGREMVAYYATHPFIPGDDEPDPDPAEAGRFVVEWPIASGYGEHLSWQFHAENAERSLDARECEEFPDSGFLLAIERLREQGLGDEEIEEQFQFHFRR